MEEDNGIYQVCTQRPAKSSKKLSRLNSMERRTLSFDETPKRTPTPLQKHKSDQFFDGFSVSGYHHEHHHHHHQMNEQKSAFKDCSNLTFDNNLIKPSTSKDNIYIDNNNSSNSSRNKPSSDIENMYSLQDNCTNVVNDCEFFSDNLWPVMPEMLSPKQLNILPRNI